MLLSHQDSTMGKAINGQFINQLLPQTQTIPTNGISYVIFFLKIAQFYHFLYFQSMKFQKTDVFYSSVRSNIGYCFLILHHESNCFVRKLEKWSSWIFRWELCRTSVIIWMHPGEEKMLMTMSPNDVVLKDCGWFLIYKMIDV